jgi:hypothetical protein
MLSASGQLENGFGVNPQDLLTEGVERLVAGALARTGARPGQPSQQAAPTAVASPPD